MMVPRTAPLDFRPFRLLEDCLFIGTDALGLSIAGHGNLPLPSTDRMMGISRLLALVRLAVAF